MDKERFNSAIVKYLALQAEDPIQFTSDIQERNERAAAYRSYDAKVISSFDEDDFVEYLGKLWALRMWGNKRYKVLEIIENTGIQTLKTSLINLLFGSNPIAERWDSFLGNVNGLGYAAASELLCYANPAEYMIYNGTTNTAFEYFGIPLVSKYSYQRTGTRYIQVCEAGKEVLEMLKEAGVPDANDLLAVDYFFWDVARIEAREAVEQELGCSATASRQCLGSNDLRASSLHDEIRDRLVDIGRLLGFDSRSEVYVATGARVDAVWEAQIGNMGKVIYVFEVQDKGSIDSLILNLIKATSNPAVQAIVAVSDIKQLEKIKSECEHTSIDALLRTWDSSAVLSTFDHLSKAHESINSLGLVPESFN